MNECTASRLSALLALLAALLLAACGAGSAEPPLEGATMGGPFTLTDHSGARLSLSDLNGTPVLLFFGFTNCPDVCPLTLSALRQSLEARLALRIERQNLAVEQLQSSAQSSSPGPTSGAS